MQVQTLEVRVSPRKSKVSDVHIPAGSVRIPAAFNGLYAFRPTMRRLPYAGAANTLLGMEHVESSVGPLSSSVNGLKVRQNGFCKVPCSLTNIGWLIRKAFFKGILDVQPWDYDAKGKIFELMDMLPIATEAIRCLDSTLHSVERRRVTA